MPRRIVYAAFAVFGALWGAWGASLPAIRDQAGISDGELGTALLFVGAGALPAMLAAGRAVDRRPQRTTAVLLVVLGAAGIVAATAGRGLLSLAAALALLGATSGAADVAINSAAGAAQRAHGGAAISRAHASFSAAVVVASLLTGLARAADLPVFAPFAAVAAAAIVLAARILALQEGVPAARRERRLRGSGVSLKTLLAIGGLGALAFAVENAHQSWSALYLRDEIGVGAAAAAVGPALFAATVAVTRFAAGANRASAAPPDGRGAGGRRRHRRPRRRFDPRRRARRARTRGRGHRRAVPDAARRPDRRCSGSPARDRDVGCHHRRLPRVPRRSGVRGRLGRLGRGSPER